MKIRLFRCVFCWVTWVFDKNQVSQKIKLGLSLVKKFSKMFSLIIKLYLLVKMPFKNSLKYEKMKLMNKVTN